MLSLDNEKKLKNVAEASFTLLETIIALGIMVVMVLEVSVILGRAVGFSKYERKVTQATWLAKFIMTQIEYKSKFYDIKEISASIKDQKFSEDVCPKDPSFDCNFTYSLTIEEWKLPVLDIALGQLDSGGEALQILLSSNLRIFWETKFLKWRLLRLPGRKVPEMIMLSWVY